MCRCGLSLRRLGRGWRGRVTGAWNDCGRGDGAGHETGRDRSLGARLRRARRVGGGRWRRRALRRERNRVGATWSGSQGIDIAGFEGRRTIALRLSPGLLASLSPRLSTGLSASLSRWLAGIRWPGLNGNLAVRGREGHLPTGGDGSHLDLDGSAWPGIGEGLRAGSDPRGGYGGALCRRAGRRRWLDRAHLLSSRLSRTPSTSSAALQLGNRVRSGI